MKETFVTELKSLATDCGVELAKRENQVAAWANRWGTEDDGAIRSAFRFLREVGSMRGSWPTFPEVASAIDRGRADMRRRQGPALMPGEQEAGQPASPSTMRRFRASLIYARVEKHQLSQQEMQEGIARFFTREFTDEDIEQYIRSNRTALATPSPQQQEA